MTDWKGTPVTIVVYAGNTMRVVAAVETWLDTDTLFDLYSLYPPSENDYHMMRRSLEEDE